MERNILIGYREEKKCHPFQAHTFRNPVSLWDLCSLNDDIHMMRGGDLGACHLRVPFVSSCPFCATARILPGFLLSQLALQVFCQLLQNKILNQLNQSFLRVQWSNIRLLNVLVSIL